MIKENIENIDEKFLANNSENTLAVKIDEIDFYFKVKLKEKSRKLVVFSNGAIDTNIRKPPVFMRSTWSDDINANCIYIDDRTIHSNGLKIGWGIGKKDRYFLKDYNKFVKLVSNLLNIEPANTVYFGSSAGGFMSMAMASENKGSKAIVNNPQNYVFNYHKGSVNKLFSVIFPNEDRSDIIEKYKDRLSITKIISQNNYFPEIHYLQNRLCKSDMENQVAPLIKMIDRYNINSEKLNFVLYNNKKAGHNPMNKQSTINYINGILDNKISILV